MTNGLGSEREDSPPDPAVLGRKAGPSHLLPTPRGAPPGDARLHLWPEAAPAARMPFPGRPAAARPLGDFGSLSAAPTARFQAGHQIYGLARLPAGDHPKPTLEGPPW